MVKITYIEFNGTEHVVDVELGMTVMEGARDNNIPIIVFPINKKNAFLDAIFNKGKYTIIK